MRQALTVVALCVLSFAAGAIAMRIYDLGMRGGGSVAQSAPTISASSGVVDFTRQPLWAYGFPEPPKPGDKASPQAPPSRNLRPNEDANEQTKPRQLPGSRRVVFSRRYSRRRECGRLVSRRSPIDARHHQARAVPDEGTTTRLRLLPPAERPRAARRMPLSRHYRQRTSPGSSSDFRDGLRRSADPRKPNTNTMIDLARAMTAEEMNGSAAKYFAAISSESPRVKVIETDLVPKTRIVGNLFLATEAEKDRADRRPHHRSARRTRSRSEALSRSACGFVAYVPDGEPRERRSIS